MGCGALKNLFKFFRECVIFVGLELRQTQKIALASQNQARTETLIRGAEFLYENGLSYHEWLANEAQEKDRDLIATYKHMAWWIYNNDYSQYKAGLMEKSLLKSFNKRYL